MNFVTRLIPTVFEQSWCIAGGFAACPVLSADIDVWVYGRSRLDEARQTLLDFIEDTKVQNSGKYGARPPYVYEPEVATEQREGSDNYEGIGINISKVCVVYGRGMNSGALPIHIMVTDAPEPGALLSAFDISTHAAAIDFRGRVFKGRSFTHPGIPPVLIRANTNTPARYRRICERFGHPVDEAYLEAQLAEINS